ncbi:MAG: hypothetical protein PVH40_05740 [Gemmatimonadales bacterium]|jgi:hypothetical protein
MPEPDTSNRRLGEWRKTEGWVGIDLDRRSGLERRLVVDRRKLDMPTLWLRPERRRSGDRRSGTERRAVTERRSGGERRLS